MSGMKRLMEELDLFVKYLIEDEMDGVESVMTYQDAKGDEAARDTMLMYLGRLAETLEAWEQTWELDNTIVVIWESWLEKDEAKLARLGELDIATPMLMDLMEVLVKEYKRGN